VARTGDIGVFKIISETALSTGVRRIEAITGSAVIDLIHEHEDLLYNSSSLLKTGIHDIPEKISHLLQGKKRVDKQLDDILERSRKQNVRDMIESADRIGGIKVLVKNLKVADDLKALGDEFRSALKSKGVALLFTLVNQKPMVMCSVTDDLTNIIHAGNVVREIGKLLGGGGGGNSHLATAGGKDPAKLTQALEAGRHLIQSIIIKERMK